MQRHSETDSCGVKEHIVENLASSLQPVVPLQLPVKINKLDNSAEKHRAFVRVFCCSEHHHNANALLC